MFNLAKCSHALKLAGALLCSSPALLGCGQMDEATDDDEAVEEVSSAAVTDRIFVQCPAGTMTAQWIQAVNGQTSSLGVATTSVSGFPIATPTSTLRCDLDARYTALVLQKVTFLQPGTVASACAAKATITGLGRAVTNSPPGGGFIFKSDRLTATPTYNAATGRCQLDIPLRPAPFLTSKVTKVCDPLTATSWSCPPGTLAR